MIVYFHKRTFGKIIFICFLLYHSKLQLFIIIKCYDIKHCCFFPFRITLNISIKSGILISFDCYFLLFSLLIIIMCLFVQPLHKAHMLHLLEMLSPWQQIEKNQVENLIQQLWNTMKLINVSKIFVFSVISK